MKRASFIRHSGMALLGLSLPFGKEKTERRRHLLQQFDKKSKDELLTNEKFWKEIASLFEVPHKFLNLENGYFLAQPQSTLHFQLNEVQKLNRMTSYFMRREQESSREKQRIALAEFSSLDPEEIALCRNTTEALDTVIHGYPWQKGDEVLVSRQDYGSMLEAFDQERRRHGIKLVWVDVPLHPKSDEEIVDAYRQKIGKRTKMMLLTHLINLSGQVLPADKLCKMAHQNGVEVMLDAAHSFAHIDFKLSDIDADYTGTSLHKWLCSPLGMGMLHIKKEHIGKIWPLFGDKGKGELDIRKFEHHGTEPVSSIGCIEEAISFHRDIGGKLKQDRLRYLQRYWTGRFRSHNRIHINTPEDTQRHGAIANVSVEGITPNTLSERLFNEFGIFSVAINSEKVNGVRITPHLWTNPGHLDRLTDALLAIAT